MTNRLVMFVVISIAVVAFAVPVAAAVAAPVFGFMGIDSVVEGIFAIAGLVVTYIVPVFARRYVTTVERRANAADYDMIADGIMAMIRRNNPNMKIIDEIDALQNQVFELLKANPKVTNNTSILERVAAAAVVRAMDSQGKNGGK